MATPPSPAQVLAELDSVAQMLAADGYALHVDTVTAAEIHVAIEALDGACADCLVGPDLLTHFMVRDLKKSRDDDAAAALPSVRVSMPSTTSH